MLNLFFSKKDLQIIKTVVYGRMAFAKNWLIDHGKNANYPGTQPVRVLTHVTIHYFQNTNIKFFDEIIKLVKQGKLDNLLDIQYGEIPNEISNGKFRTPKIVNVTKTIQLHETFLSYQWCITYAKYTIFVETIDYPKVNAEAGSIVKIINPDIITKATEVFNHAKFLIKNFDKWDLDDLPNPEKYPVSNRDYIEQSNMFYTEGMKFILCHEIVHAKKHLDNLPAESCPTCFQEMEFEADNEAIDNILLCRSE